MASGSIDANQNELSAHHAEPQHESAAVVSGVIDKSSINPSGQEDTPMAKDHLPGSVEASSKPATNLDESISTSKQQIELPASSETESTAKIQEQTAANTEASTSETPKADDPLIAPAESVETISPSVPPHDNNESQIPSETLTHSSTEGVGTTAFSNPLPAATSTYNGMDVLSVDSDPFGTDQNDNDSAMGGSIRSSTYSTTSSVYKFVEENGRTYHSFKEGKYFLPNDEVEKDRLDMQHQICQMVFGTLNRAPLDNLEGGVHHALDIATGTGIWAIEFAEKYPGAVIQGTDLSPIQPDYVPPNCHFEVDDAEDPWIYSHKFDYIHGGMLVTCFNSHKNVFKSAFDSLRPGGYLELQDVDLPVKCIDNTWEGSAFHKFWELIMEASRALGKDWTRVKRYKQLLEEIGFVDVVEEQYSFPIGSWAKGIKNKTVGVWTRENMLQTISSMGMATLSRGLGMTQADIELLLVDVRKDIKKAGAESLHTYGAIYVVYGRKP